MLETMLGPNLTPKISRRPTRTWEEKGLAASQLGLDDVLLVERFVTQHALEAEARDVDRPLASSDDLGDGAAGGRRLLQAVAGEAVTQYHVGHVRVPVYKGVDYRGRQRVGIAPAYILWVGLAPYVLRVLGAAPV